MVSQLDLRDITRERYQEQLLDIMEEANGNEQQGRFFKRWFEEYKDSEYHAYVKWFKHTQTFVLGPDIQGGVPQPPELDEGQELVEFNSFIATLWRKYHYCAVR